ncbi:OmpH family outer membrane protein [soil metagenome]
MKLFTLVTLLLSFSLSAHAADLKIGVVDLSKIFAEYHKTKAANAVLQENQGKAKEEMAERFSTLKKLNDELEKIRKEASDPVLNEEIRGKKRAQFESKVQEMRSLDQQISEFKQRREQQLQQEGMQQRKGLYEDIVKAVTEKSKTDGYDLVFDKSGLSAFGLPLLLHAKEGVTQDFTDAVITQLNKDAPAAAATPAPAPAPEEKPVTKKSKEK